MYVLNLIISKHINVQIFLKQKQKNSFCMVIYFKNTPEMLLRKLKKKTKNYRRIF